MPSIFDVSRRGRAALLACAMAAMTVSAANSSADEQSATAESAALNDQDMRRGRILFLQCRACHSLTPADNEGKIGPSLAGIFGRTAGSADYFDGYSAALKDADHEWNSATLDRWLVNPAAMVPGTSMVFAGIADEGQRALLVRYLNVMTASPAN